jgi:hypothetical protein
VYVKVRLLLIHIFEVGRMLPGILEVTRTFVVAVTEQPGLAAVIEYIPLIGSVAPITVGLARDEEKPAGPDQV